MVQEQVIPVNDLVCEQKIMRREQSEAIAELELKLNKSYLLLTNELDNLKDPLMDMMQDLDQQRHGVMMELERTQTNNRQLLMRTY